MRHTHKIDGVKHATFLREGRIDPITGERLKVSDHIVFCAACRSAFLEESWEYLEGSHCDQRNTLSDFPVESPLKLSKLSGVPFFSMPLPERTKPKLSTSLLPAFFTFLGMLILLSALGVTFAALLSFVAAAIVGWLKHQHGVYQHEEAFTRARKGIRLSVMTNFIRLFDPNRSVVKNINFSHIVQCQISVFSKQNYSGGFTMEFQLAYLGGSTTLLFDSLKEIDGMKLLEALLQRSNDFPISILLEKNSLYLDLRRFCRRRKLPAKLSRTHKLQRTPSVYLKHGLLG
ncbi:MAG: hypothetical protein AAF740_00610 [Bacteroidota bacterium]